MIYLPTETASIITILLKILLLDNFDSFTYMLKDYLEQCGCKCLTYRNNAISIAELDKIEFDAIVISPGPKVPKTSGILMDLIEAYYEKKPILGICLGHQAIGEFFGAELHKAVLPRHGKVDSMHHTNDVMFNQIPSPFNATRYHSLVIDKLPSELITTCSYNNEVMAFRHESLPIWGVQFHPESCETQYGLQLIKNYIEGVKTNMLSLC